MLAGQTLNTQCKRASARAHLRTQTDHANRQVSRSKPFDAIARESLSLWVPDSSKAFSAFPIFLIFYFISYIEIYAQYAFFVGFLYRWFLTLSRLSNSAGLLIFVCSPNRRFKSAPCYSPQLFFEYIFRFQKDIVDVALVLFLAYNRMARIKRRSIRGKFYWPLSTAERATAENGMRHTMLP